MGEKVTTLCVIVQVDAAIHVHAQEISIYLRVTITLFYDFWFKTHFGCTTTLSNYIYTLVVRKLCS